MRIRNSAPHSRGIAPVYARQIYEKGAAHGRSAPSRTTEKAHFADIVGLEKSDAWSRRIRTPRRSRGRDARRGFEEYGDAARSRISATRGCIWIRLRPERAKTSCSRPSWARCATSISASTPIRRPLRPSRLTRPIGRGHARTMKLTETIGIMKAYSSCVGEGPFTCRAVRRRGGKAARGRRRIRRRYGPAAPGRPVRRGGLPHTACRCQGADEMALTKLDILDSLDEIPVTVAYEAGRKGRFMISPMGMCWSRRSPSTKCSRDGGRIFPAAGKKKSCRGRRSSISHLSKKRSA